LEIRYLHIEIASKNIFFNGNIQKLYMMHCSMN
jgi:hypothetical protein